MGVYVGVIDGVGVGGKEHCISIKLPSSCKTNEPSSCNKKHPSVCDGVTVGVGVKVDV